MNPKDPLRKEEGLIAELIITFKESDSCMLLGHCSFGENRYIGIEHEKEIFDYIYSDERKRIDCILRDSDIFEDDFREIDKEDVLSVLLHDRIVDIVFFYTLSNECSHNQFYSFTYNILSVKLAFVAAPNLYIHFAYGGDFAGNILYSFKKHRVDETKDIQVFDLRKELYG